MPIRYRHYHIKKIVEYVEKQNENINGNKEMTGASNSPDKIHPPDFVSKVKAPKK